MIENRRLRSRWAHEIEEKRIDWLWRPWLARGVITILDGQPGSGKSTMMVDLISRISTGSPFPEIRTIQSLETNKQVDAAPAAADAGHVAKVAAVAQVAQSQRIVDDQAPVRPAGRVILVPAEEAATFSVRPRLTAASADYSQIKIIDYAESAGAAGQVDSPIQLPRDFDLLAGECRDLRPDLLVIDTIMEVLGLDERNRYVKPHDDQAVRRAIGKFKALAEELNMCVVLLRHLNKASGGTAMTRGSGSIGFNALARTVMLLGDDPCDHRCRVLAMVKTNLDAMPRSVGLRIDNNAGSPVVAWLGDSDHRADDLLRRFNANIIPPALAAAQDFLKAALIKGNAETWERLTELAAAKGISDRTLLRARKALRLDKAYRDGKPVWALPIDMLRQVHSKRRPPAVDGDDGDER